MDATQAEDRYRLERCIEDLIAVLALPAIWHEQSSRQALATLNDALWHILAMTFMRAGIGAASGAETSRASWRLDDALVHLTSDEQSGLLNAIFSPDEAGKAWLQSLHAGLPARLAALDAAASNEGYPGALEMLLLRVAVGQDAARLEDQADRRPPQCKAAPR